MEFAKTGPFCLIGSDDSWQLARPRVLGSRSFLLEVVFQVLPGVGIGINLPAPSSWEMEKPCNSS